MLYIPQRDTCGYACLVFEEEKSVFCETHPWRMVILVGSCEDEEQVEKPVFWSLLSSGRQVPLLARLPHVVPACPRYVVQTISEPR